MTKSTLSRVRKKFFSTDKEISLSIARRQTFLGQKLIFLKEEMKRKAYVAMVALRGVVKHCRKKTIALDAVKLLQKGTLPCDKGLLNPQSDAAGDDAAAKATLWDAPQVRKPRHFDYASSPSKRKVTFSIDEEEMKELKRQRHERQRRPRFVQIQELFKLGTSAYVMSNAAGMEGMESPPSSMRVREFKSPHAGDNEERQLMKASSIGVYDIDFPGYEENSLVGDEISVFSINRREPLRPDVPEMGGKVKEMDQSSLPANVAKKKSTTKPLPVSVPSDSRQTVGTWKCMKCLFVNSVKLKFCPACGTSSKEKTPSAAMPIKGYKGIVKVSNGCWTCDMCFSTNRIRNSVCRWCGAYKPGFQTSLGWLDGESDSLPFYYEPLRTQPTVESKETTTSAPPTSMVPEPAIIPQQPKNKTIWACERNLMAGGIPSFAFPAPRICAITQPTRLALNPQPAALNISTVQPAKPPEKSSPIEAESKSPPLVFEWRPPINACNDKPEKRKSQWSFAKTSTKAPQNNESINTTFSRKARKRAADENDAQQPTSDFASGNTGKRLGTKAKYESASKVIVYLKKPKDIDGESK